MPELDKLIQLIKDAIKRDGRPLEAIVVAAGVRLKTVEGWLNGYTASPPLVGIMRLCLELRIPPDTVALALEDELSPSAAANLQELLQPPDAEAP
jgi:transcriptional regulator with XRE-family HTH domain